MEFIGSCFANVSGGEAGSNVTDGNATDGYDVIRLGDGAQTIDGLDGDDLIFGEKGFDRLEGKDGDDILRGTESIDEVLFAAALSSEPTFDSAEIEPQPLSVLPAGADDLFGGAGDDTLILGANDSGTGGLGADRFVLSTNPNGYGSYIVDFNPAAGDRMRNACLKRRQCHPDL